jgi:hypothetical protein
LHQQGPYFLFGRQLVSRVRRVEFDEETTVSLAPSPGLPVEERWHARETIIPWNNRDPLEHLGHISIVG